MIIDTSIVIAYAIKLISCTLIILYILKIAKTIAVKFIEKCEKKQLEKIISDKEKELFDKKTIQLLLNMLPDKITEIDKLYDKDSLLKDETKELTKAIVNKLIRN